MNLLCLWCLPLPSTSPLYSGRIIYPTSAHPPGLPQFQLQNHGANVLSLLKDRPLLKYTFSSAVLPSPRLIWVASGEEQLSSL